MNISDFKKFKTTDKSKYYTLKPHHMQQVNTIIKKEILSVYNAARVKPLPAISHIIDATAHVGTDTVNFVKTFKCVCIAIEIDGEVVKLLKENLVTFGIEELTHVVHANCLEFLQGFKMKTDFVYFDVPWGGATYWNKKQIDLFLTDPHGKKMNMSQIIKFTFSQGFTDIIIAKVPNNFVTSKFMKQFNKNKYIITWHPVYKSNKFYYDRNMKRWMCVKSGEKIVAFFIVIVRLAGVMN